MRHIVLNEAQASRNICQLCPITPLTMRECKFTKRQPILDGVAVVNRLTEVAAAAVREAAAQLRGRPSCPAPPHVPHVRQHFNWDCGLACVLMILRALGVRGVDFASLRRLCPTTRHAHVSPPRAAFECRTSPDGRVQSQALQLFIVGG